jgi:hypothetical protein
MKKIIFIALIFGVSFTSCKKDPDPVSTVVTVTYPTINLIGAPFVSQSVGSGTYVDSGATGTNDLTGVTTNLTPVSNTVDLTKAGFYTVVYKTKNSNGFVTSKTRFVLVTGVSPSDDWSGLWQRNADPTRPANVIKINTGLYQIDNVGGVIIPDQAPGYAAYLGFVNDSTIEIPIQISPTDGSTVVGAGDCKFYITPSDTIMQWHMTAGPFLLTNTRVFYKAH